MYKLYIYIYIYIYMQLLFYINQCKKYIFIILINFQILDRYFGKN